jgi:hypothetical protein
MQAHPQSLSLSKPPRSKCCTDTYIRQGCTLVAASEGTDTYAQERMFVSSKRSLHQLPMEEEKQRRGLPQTDMGKYKQ